MQRSQPGCVLPKVKAAQDYIQNKRLLSTVITKSRIRVWDHGMLKLKWVPGIYGSGYTFFTIEEILMNT